MSERDTACGRDAREREISLLGGDDFPGLPAEELEPWLEALVRELAPEADSFTVRFTDDATMRGYNERFRGKDAPTDVLSFPGQEGPEGHHLGDVLISAPTARRQAREAGCALDEELRRLILHGALHCLGYDHEIDDGTMERLEEKLAPRWVEAT